ncbi:hypothetical protein Pelo_19406 [Pelomyxa schiedti]|nr:hypothetical protein Pelo_19406 [Pelomyxa schiedti]
MSALGILGACGATPSASPGGGLGPTKGVSSIVGAASGTGPSAQLLGQWHCKDHESEYAKKREEIRKKYNLPDRSKKDTTDAELDDLP